MRLTNMGEGDCATRRSVRERVDRARRAQGLIGSSSAFIEALEQLARFAAADVPVFVAGETGTGKELAARAIHYLSARTCGPFVAINCGALPERLFENELFGHTKGAFTDARETQQGLIAQAEGGTLLLDEIDCLDLHSQAALLRFLQDSSYRPLGAGRTLVADVRIVASTNTDLEARVAEGRFRDDLLFRLDVGRVELPALRDRGTDILPLARHLLSQAAARHRLGVPRIGPLLERRLLRYGWPGNVRELENVMHRGLLLADGGPEVPETLRLGSQAFVLSDGADCADNDEPGQFFGTLKSERARRTQAFEREYLAWVLEHSRGNITAASMKAGTERRHLGRLIQRHGIDASEFRRKGSN